MPISSIGMKSQAQSYPFQETTGSYLAILHSAKLLSSQVANLNSESITVYLSSYIQRWMAAPREVYWLLLDIRLRSDLLHPSSLIRDLATCLTVTVLLAFSRLR